MASKREMMLNRSLYRQAGCFFFLSTVTMDSRGTQGASLCSGNSEKTKAESVSLSSLCQGSQGKPQTDRETGRPLHPLHRLYCKLAPVAHPITAYLFSPFLLLLPPYNFSLYLPGSERITSFKSQRSFVARNCCVIIVLIYKLNQKRAT